MKTISHLYLLLRVVVFAACLILIMPFAALFRVWYLEGLASGFNKFIDEAEKTELASKEACDELRRELPW